MSAAPNSLKTASLIALAALGALFAGGIFFYKERLLFADASFIAFNIINYKSLGIQLQRYGSVVTQIVPYLGQKFHLPIRPILIGYTVSFNLFYLLAASFLVFVLKNFRLAILMAFYYFLLASDTWFWTNNEIHQAVAWMFLFFGAIFYSGSRKLSLPILLPIFALLGIITVFTHFIVIIPTVFLWVYFLLEKEHWPFSKTLSIVLSGILGLILIAKFISAGTGNYDSQHLHGATHFSIKDVFLSFFTIVVRNFLIRCFTNYWLALLLLAVGLFSLFKTGEKKLLAWTVLSTLGYIILMGLTYKDTPEHFHNPWLYHIESEWESLGIIMAAPFVFVTLPAMKPQRQIIALIFIFAIRIAYISSAIPAFTWRTRFKEEVMAQMKRKGITKLVLASDPVLQNKCLQDWTLPEESLLLSALNGDKPLLTFSFINPADSQRMNSLKNSKGYFYAYGILNPLGINTEYYSIDTSQNYQFMTYSELFK